MTDPYIKHVTYHNSAGGVARGTQKWNISPSEKNHITRGFWLTSHVETNGIFGTCQNYDRTGMTACLAQKIAVFPASGLQGPLFGVIDHLRDDPAIAPPHMKTLLGKFDVAGWLLDPSGVLRNKITGEIVSGQEIRKQFTPPDGNVPAGGPEWDQCKGWIQAFYFLFSDSSTFNLQIKLGKASLANLDPAEAKIYMDLFGVHDPSVLIAGQNIRMDQDLALCVYHAHSVNAPSIARKVLVNSHPDKTKDWPKRFLMALEHTRYGNWDKRWVKTRVIAENSNLWPQELFSGPEEIMPELGQP